MVKKMTGYEFYPIGTKVEAFIQAQGHIKGVVLKTERIGVDNFVISVDTGETNVFGDKELEVFNTAYVTKIVERGKGKMYSGEWCSRGICKSYPGHKSQYREPLGEIIIPMALNSRPMDYIDHESLYDHLIFLRVFRLKRQCNGKVVFPWRIINKKKLKKLVKQNIDRFIIPKRVQLAEEEIEDEREFRLLYTMFNEEDKEEFDKELTEIKIPCEYDSQKENKDAEQ